jgi:hypothetical protein
VLREFCGKRYEFSREGVERILSEVEKERPLGES